jgi:hypothetical protein
MIGIPTPTWLPSANTDDTTRTGAPTARAADADFDLDGLPDDDELPDELPDDDCVTVFVVTVDGVFEPQAVTRTAAAASAAVSRRNGRDRGEMRKDVTGTP